MKNRPAPHGALIANAGFISIPRYFDYSPQEFLEVAPKGVGTIQRVLHIPDYTYELEQRANNLQLLEEAAVCLGSARCQVIGQTGVNWSHCTGTTPDEIRVFCDNVSEISGAKFLMMGLCIVDALKEIRAKNIAVSNAYYAADWASGINRFLTEAGFNIVWSGTMVEQGMYESQAEMHRIAEEIDWVFPTKHVVQSIYQCHVAAPDVDAVVQTGFGFRTRKHLATLEAVIEKPIITSDMSLYWAMLKVLNLAPLKGYGELMDSLQ